MYKIQNRVESKDRIQYCTRMCVLAYVLWRQLCLIWLLIFFVFLFYFPPTKFAPMYAFHFGTITCSPIIIDCVYDLNVGLLFGWILFDLYYNEIEKKKRGEKKKKNSKQKEQKAKAKGDSKSNRTLCNHMINHHILSR